MTTKCPNCGYDPTDQPIYHALIKTPDNVWNPIVSSINKHLVMSLAKEFAIRSARTVKISKDTSYNAG